MTKHRHECLCGTSWNCIINILPLPDGLGRARCENWPESICDNCIESCLANQPRRKRKLILESMSKIPDALLAWRARARLESEA